MVEDTEAEEIERVRARKEGGPAWNEAEQKRYVRVYPDEHMGEEIRVGYDSHITSTTSPTTRNKKTNKPEGAEAKEQGARSANESPGEDEGIWKDNQSKRTTPTEPPTYGSMTEERDIWGRAD